MQKLLSGIALVVSLSSCDSKPPEPTYKEAPGGFQLRLETKKNSRNLNYRITTTDINKPKYCQIKAGLIIFPGGAGNEVSYDCEDNLLSFSRYEAHKYPPSQECDIYQKMPCDKFEDEAKEFLNRVKLKVNYESGMKHWKKENK